MSNSINTLTLLAEITIAFVAFATITASIKLSIGDELSAYQRLVIHYFTESAMISISVALLALLLLDFFPQGEVFVSTIVCAYAFVIGSLYLLWYMKRRIRIQAPTPLTSALVIASYVVLMFLLAITISGMAWEPSLEIVSAICVTNLVGASVIFVSFLSVFIDSPRGNDA